MNSFAISILLWLEYYSEDLVYEAMLQVPGLRNSNARLSGWDRASFDFQGELIFFQM